MTSTSPLHTDYSIYARELWSLGHGHPMWSPEPSPTYGQIRLGDVGYLLEGDFLFLFNCMLEAHDPINKRGVPDDFQPFSPPHPDSIQYRPDNITQRELHSTGLSSLAVSEGASISEPARSALAAASIRYQCTRTAGALLLLQDNAHKWSLNCELQIKEHMGAHIEEWHAFASAKLGIEVQQEDLIFVSGYTKTTLWAVTAFNGSSVQGELLRISGGWPAAWSDFRVSMSRSADTSVCSRIGPSHRLQAASETSDARPDQCVFLNYHKAKQRKSQPPKVTKAATGLNDSGFDGNDDNVTSNIGHDCKDSASSVSPSQSTSEVSQVKILRSRDDYIAIDRYQQAFNPVDHLLDYMLKNSDAETVCASDTDVTSLFPNTDLPYNLELVLNTLQVPIWTEGYGSVITSSFSVPVATDGSNPGSTLPGGHQIPPPPNPSTDVQAVPDIDFGRDRVPIDHNHPGGWSDTRISKVHAKRVKYSERVIASQAELRALVLEKLRQITGKHDAQMRWLPAPYMRHVVARYRVRIEGWPLDEIPFERVKQVIHLPKLEALLKGFKDGVIYFRSITDVEYEAMVADPTPWLGKTEDWDDED